MQKIKFPFDVDKLFDKCVKHKNIPRNDFEKQAVLIHIIKDFEDKKVYSEEEVNDTIKQYFDDHALLRRELVNFGYLQGDPATGRYWVVKRELTKGDIMNNTLLRRHAKAYGLDKG